MTRPLETNDVIRIVSGKCKGKTGVVGRLNDNNVNVFLKGEYIGIWFDIKELKRIGKVKK